VGQRNRLRLRPKAEVGKRLASIKKRVLEGTSPHKAVCKPIYLKILRAISPAATNRAPAPTAMGEEPPVNGTAPVAGSAVAATGPAAARTMASIATNNITFLNTISPR
jgi:hypothetical protein